MDVRGWAAFFVFLLVEFRLSDAINCWQCNIFVQGSTNTCDNPRNMTECSACLKTYTRIRIHERWLQFRDSEVVSRYCIKPSSTALTRDHGCYYQRNNGGMTERCYCYTNQCNAVDTFTHFGLRKLLVVVALVGFALCAQ